MEKELLRLLKEYGAWVDAENEKTEKDIEKLNEEAKKEADRLNREARSKAIKQGSYFIGNIHPNYWKAEYIQKDLYSFIEWLETRLNTNKD